MTRVVVAYGVADAHELLRAEAARLHGVPIERVALAHECPRCGSIEHGRPLLLPTASMRRLESVSLARAGSLSVVALSDVGVVGVDVEEAGAADFHGFDAVALHADEQVPDRTAAWVRKEAVLKALGTGLATDPREVRVDGGASWRTAAGDLVVVHDLDVEGYAVSVAVVGPEAVVVGLEVLVRAASI